MFGLGFGFLGVELDTADKSSFFRFLFVSDIKVLCERGGWLSPPPFASIKHLYFPSFRALTAEPFGVVPEADTSSFLRSSVNVTTLPPIFCRLIILRTRPQSWAEVSM